MCIARIVQSDVDFGVIIITWNKTQNAMSHFIVPLLCIPSGHYNDVCTAKESKNDAGLVTKQ